MDAQTKMIFGAGARTRGLQKVQKIEMDCFSVKSYMGFRLNSLHNILNNLSSDFQSPLTFF